ncbi:MAG: hypothetical protein KJ621_16035 [Proteobacteria bacterium]|nr:hypothetical protein [Pseudomonadota bacterium]MBU1741720.1 hypothetical protein [Pseudomonadota bacterium]
MTLTGDDQEPGPWRRHDDGGVPTTIRYPRISVGDLLQRPVAGLPDKPALEFFGSTTTFRRLRLQALRLTDALGALGVSQGDRVGLHPPSRPLPGLAAQVGRGRNPAQSAQRRRVEPAPEGIGRRRP